MSNITLSQTRVKALRPRTSAYDIRDAKLKGFGVRVPPSGAKRFFIHSQHRGTRAWKIVGDASAMHVDEARVRAASLLAAIRCEADAPVSADATRFELVAETVFQRYARVWKPQTLYVNRHYLRRQILPRFAGTQIAEITRADVQRWFASLRATPVAADRSVPILSVIMTEAERRGYRPEGSNPCRGIRRYRRRGRERYLSDAEIGRLGATLSMHEGERPLQVAAVRLLLLTGCRKSEVLTLRWSDYREGRLFLPDSKTGPRTVWLSSAARNVLDGIERTGAWVFPAPRSDGSADPNWLGHFWQRVRAEVDLSDVRLHDLRHSHATFALRQGVRSTRNRKSDSATSVDAPHRSGPAYRTPRTANSNKWMPSQPIASWTTPCTSRKDMDSGTRTRRQIIGLIPSSRTLSCRIPLGGAADFTDSMAENYALRRDSIKVDPTDLGASERDREHLLGGFIQLDDAYLGGERSGGKRGRGAPGKTPFVAAVETNERGHPLRVKFTVVEGFRLTEIAAWAQQHLSSGTQVLSDGLACFNGVTAAGCVHEPMVTGGGKAAVERPEFRWVNTILGNIKSALRGTYHAIRPKYAQRYLAEFEYRFNRRFDLPDIIPRLLYVALRTPPMPERLLKLRLA